MILSSRLASFGGLVLALAVSTSPAMAVKCGDTITKNTVLTANLPCKVSPALFVKGPATLDLNGHTVSCTTNDGEYSEGITISGKGATIKNGIVSGCINGIYTPDAASTDGALIKDIIAFDNYPQSIYIRGNNNRLLNVKVTATTAREDRLALDGDNNQVKDCYLLRSIISLSGSSNTAISNIIVDVKDTCLYYVFGGGSVIKNNTFRRCGLDGVHVDARNASIVDNKFYSVARSSIYSSGSFYDDSFTSTRIAGNRIYKSGVHGIDFYRVRNAVVDSNVIVNSAENGINFGLGTRRCTIKNNTIRKCGMAGLRVRGADANNFTNNKISICKTGINAGVGSNRNRMINNRASNNTLFDLSDSSANCGSNVWKGNTGKGNRACTQKK